jgi:hypothetical protein
MEDEKQDVQKKASLLRRALGSLIACIAILLVSVFVMLLGYAMVAGPFADGEMEQLIDFLKLAFLPHAILPALVAIVCGAIIKQPKVPRVRFALLVLVGMCANGWLVVTTFAFALVAFGGGMGAFPE